MSSIFMLNVIMPEKNTFIPIPGASSLHHFRVKHESARDSLLLSRFIATHKNVGQKKVYTVINTTG